MELGTTPLVSVIIPAYNQVELLARAIDSSLSQTYPAKEIIVVNDGSPNRMTHDTALSYGDKIIYVERANGGVAAARNSGIEQARGELIALLDQDDIWLPNKLARQVSIVLAHPEVALIHSSYYLIDENGQRTGVRRLQEGRYDPLPDLLLDVAISACTTLFSRRLLDQVGPFDPMLNGSDDWDMWLRIAALGYPFYCIGEPLAEYRVHSGMTSHDDIMMAQTGLAVLDKFYSRTSLPDVAAKCKDRAYFNKRTWAVSVYYGLGRLVEAQAELQAATLLYLGGIATGRFIRSLVNAQAEAKVIQPDKAMVRDAVRFVLKQTRLPRHLMNRLRRHGQLLLALHAPGGKLNKAKDIALTFLRNPMLALDDEIWAAAGRLVRRTARLMIGGKQ